MKLSDLASFIVTLTEFDNPATTTSEALREAGYILRHISVSFLLLTDNETANRLLQVTDLAFTIVDGQDDKCAAVVSGNLQQWRTSIINGCVSREDYVTRSFFDNVLLEFEKLGLAQLWANYQKSRLPDKTFALVPK